MDPKESLMVAIGLVTTELDIKAKAIRGFLIIHLALAQKKRENTPDTWMQRFVRWMPKS